MTVDRKSATTTDKSPATADEAGSDSRSTPNGSLSGPAAERFEAIRGALSRRRAELGISMSQLARQIGVSPSMISQIERGQSLPSVATLFALADALGAELDAFFTDPEVDRGAVPATAVPDPSIADDSERLPHVTEAAWRGRDDGPKSDVDDLYMVSAGRRTGLDIRGGVRWERLTPVPLRHLEFLELIYAPHAQSDTELYRHPGVEMVYVVEGRFVVYVGFDEYDLGPGDSLAFPSSRPHRYTNPTDSVSRAVTVILHEPVGAQQLFSVESVARSMGESDAARGSRRPLGPDGRGS